MNTPDSLVAEIESLGKEASTPRAVKSFTWGTFWTMDVPGSEALRYWQHLGNRARQTGFWPVIVSSYPGPGVGTAERLIEDDEELSPTATVDAAFRFTFDNWVEQERDPEFQIAKHLREAEIWAAREFGETVARSHREIAEMWRQQPKRELDPDDYQIPPAMNCNPPQQELNCLQWYDYDQKRSKEADSVSILFVPTEFSWQVPAYLSYTTMEGQRRPELHVAALKWLLDRFGAELVGIDTRILEVIPQKRPRGKKEAIQTAEAIGTYSCCAVTSENEMASIEELAHYLMESNYWSFCWP
jgi:hypothetical protein